jgi:hypothetical protein
LRRCAVAWGFQYALLASQTGRAFTMGISSVFVPFVNFVVRQMESVQGDVICGTYFREMTLGLT